MEEALPQGIQSIRETKRQYQNIGPLHRKGKSRFLRYREFDTQGRMILDQRPKKKRLYKYQGDLLQGEILLNDLNEKLEEVRYFYNSQGHCIKREIQLVEEELPRAVEIRHEMSQRLVIEQEGRAVRAMQSNSEGRLTKELLYQEDKPDGIINYQYNQAGCLISIERKDPKGERRTIQCREYNENGLLVQEIWKDQEEREMRRLHYSYPAGDDLHWLICQVSSPKGTGDQERPLYEIQRELNLHPQENGFPAMVQPEAARPESSTEESAISDIPPEPNDSGRQTVEYPDGSIYQGELLEGLPHGSGEIRYSDGSSYHGQFKEGKLEGHGEMHWPSGDRYSGAFKDGAMHGLGEFTWSTGKRFKGWFEGGSPSKQGIYFDD